ncbi:hypothetical protein P7K49_015232 [Saguinus oedipus]|uniref:Uncharacterized protein n=1 Tax=Saguinus oedipus TaxID=9490 RepID=A0ABQ9V8N1_SAGOE|nr:hypothetical protein P7K49_015232 [Saguinus oedipus]
MFHPKVSGGRTWALVAGPGAGRESGNAADAATVQHGLLPWGGKLRLSLRAGLRKLLAFIHSELSGESSLFGVSGRWPALPDPSQNLQLPGELLAGVAGLGTHACLSPAHPVAGTSMPSWVLVHGATAPFAGASQGQVALQMLSLPESWLLHGWKAQSGPDTNWTEHQDRRSKRAHLWGQSLGLPLDDRGTTLVRGIVAGALFFEDLEQRHKAQVLVEDISDILEEHAERHFHPYISYCSNEVYQQRTLQKLT